MAQLWFTVTTWKTYMNKKTQQTHILWFDLQHHRWRLQEGWRREEERGCSEHIFCSLRPSIWALSEVGHFQFRSDKHTHSHAYSPAPKHYVPFSSNPVTHPLLFLSLFQNNDAVRPSAYQNTCQVLVSQELSLPFIQGTCLALWLHTNIQFFLPVHKNLTPVLKRNPFRDLLTLLSKENFCGLFLPLWWSLFLFRGGELSCKNSNKKTEGDGAKQFAFFRSVCNFGGNPFDLTNSDWWNLILTSNCGYCQPSPSLEACWEGIF